MATSGSYSFSVTANDIIREAMLNVGELGETEQPTAQEFVDCLRKLNMIVKQWMAKQDFAPGLKMWKRRHADLFLSSTTGQYNLGSTGDNWTLQSWQQQSTASAAASATTISVPVANLHANDFVGIILDSGAIFWTTIQTVGGSSITIAAGLPSSSAAGNWLFNYTTKAQRPELIESCVLRDTSGADVPMRLWSLQDYDICAYKAQVGYQSDPSAVYYEAQLGNGTLFTDVPGASDVSKHFHISFMEPIQDFVNSTDNPEYPQRWYRALAWGLTKEIAPMFNLPFLPTMQENLQESLAIAREPDPDSTNIYFMPGIE